MAETLILKSYFRGEDLWVRKALLNLKVPNYMPKNLTLEPQSDWGESLVEYTILYSTIVIPNQSYDSENIAYDYQYYTKWINSMLKTSHH